MVADQRYGGSVNKKGGRQVGPYILEAKRGDQGAKQNILASEARIPEGPLAKEKTWKGANTGTEPVREKYDAKQDARRDGGARTSEVDGTRCTRHGWETNRSNEDMRLRKGAVSYTHLTLPTILLV